MVLAGYATSFASTSVIQRADMTISIDHNNNSNNNDNNDTIAIIIAILLLAIDNAR